MHLTSLVKQHQWLVQILFKCWMFALVKEALSSSGVPRLHLLILPHVLSVFIGIQHIKTTSSVLINIIDFQSFYTPTLTTHHLSQINDGGEIDTRSQQSSGIMCPCQAVKSGEMNSALWADSYPSSPSSNRRCGNPSCPIRRCGWIPLWPAWAPPPQDRSRQDKKDEKTLSISQTPKCGAQTKSRKKQIRKQATHTTITTTIGITYILIKRNNKKKWHTDPEFCKHVIWLFSDQMISQLILSIMSR